MTKVVFIAEMTDLKFKTFWNQEEVKEENKNLLEADEKYTYEANFGETLEKKKRPQIVIIDLQTFKL